MALSRVFSFSCPIFLLAACSTDTSSTSPGSTQGTAGSAGAASGVGGAGVGSSTTTTGNGGGNGGRSSGAGGGAGGQSGGRGGTDDAGPDVNNRDSGRLDAMSGDSGAATGPAGGACPSGEVFGNPLPQDHNAVLVRGGFMNAVLEAPVWVPSQRALFFSEITSPPVTSGRIQKYTPADDKLVVFVDNVGVGGLAMDPQGMMVAASHDMQRLTRFDPVSGQRTDVPGGSMYMGKPFNQVNDVVVRSDGNMYFSDPTYQLAGRQGQDTMAFYRLSPAGVVTRIATADNPNGVALSPDGTLLYLTTTGGPPMQRFALAGDGSIAGTPMTFTGVNSDGMAVDCAGNLYLADSGQIKVISPTAQPLGIITGLTAGFVTNSAFGGDDRKTLYITTSEAVYQIKLNIPGFPN